jgi:hypothetical protein
MVGNLVKQETIVIGSSRRATSFSVIRTMGKYMTSPDASADIMFIPTVTDTSSTLLFLVRVSHRLPSSFVEMDISNNARHHLALVQYPWRNGIVLRSGVMSRDLSAWLEEQSVKDARIRYGLLVVSLVWAYSLFTFQRITFAGVS